MKQVFCFLICAEMLSRNAGELSSVDQAGGARDAEMFGMHCA